jgi:hypothetical protein
MRAAFAEAKRVEESDKSAGVFDASIRIYCCMFLHSILPDVMSRALSKIIFYLYILFYFSSFFL